MTNSKRYVFDTSVILEAAAFIEKFANSDNTVVLHPVVIEELRGNKNGFEPKNLNARAALRILLELSRQKKLAEGSLTVMGGIVKLDNACLWEHKFSRDWSLEENDNKILALAAAWTKEKENVVLVTLDNEMIIKANEIGIKVEDVRDIRIDLDKLYNGFRNVVVTKEFTDILKKNNFIDRDVFRQEIEKDFYENEFVIPNTNHELVFRYKKNKLQRVCAHPRKVFSHGPKNLDQIMAWDLLTDPEVTIVSLVGRAGTGKTFLSLLAAMAQLEDFSGSEYRKCYSSLVVLTPTAPASREQYLGLLKGGKMEKLSPWLGAIFDNIKIIKRSKKGLLDESSKTPSDCKRDDIIQRIEFEHIDHMRGRSLEKCFVIIDEAQNFNRAEIKLIGTRIAEGAKIVLCGDPSQVSRNFLSANNNGLVYAVEALKNIPEAGSVLLDNVERSRTSEIFTELF